MGASAIYGIPWPELSAQADGPDGFQDIAAKLETTLANETRVFSQNFTGFTFVSGARSLSLTAVPLGRPVLINIQTTVRLYGPIFCVVQVFDGITQVGGDQAFTLPGGASSNVTSATVSVAKVFTAVPEVRFTLGGTYSTDVDSVRVTGLGFGWPS